MQLNYKYVNLIITICLFFALFIAGSLLYGGFSGQVFLNMFIDNAFLLVAAIGMTFVLIIGGIDISIGSVIALICMLSAHLLEIKQFSPWLVIPSMLGMGAVFGLLQGCLIHYFQIQPFIVTLAGMFLARGLCYVISINTILITNDFYQLMATYRIPLPFDMFISPSVVIALAVLVLAYYLLNCTKFGRAVYAIGGNEQSAILMGLPVGRTKVLVYVLNGVCASLSGIVLSFYMLSGYGLHAVGLEMDAIASVVIGGTPLTGGVGFITGTLFGVLIQGVIQTLIMFQGTLSSWWTKIAIAGLLCLFIVLQRLIAARKESRKSIV